MHTPLFGAISVNDFKPGFAFAFSSDLQRVYVVKTITGGPKKTTAQERFDIYEMSNGETKKVPCILPPGVHLPYQADIYEQQTDGTYTKVGQKDSPVGFGERGRNPYFDPVQVKIKGNKLTLNA
jgi:hypothetical protein